LCALAGFSPQIIAFSSGQTERTNGSKTEFSPGILVWQIPYLLLGITDAVDETGSTSAVGCHLLTCTCHP